MRLSANSIRRMIKEGHDFASPQGTMWNRPLIEPVSSKRFKHIEGGTYDLTLLSVEYASGYARIPADSSSDARTIGPHQECFVENYHMPRHPVRVPCPPHWQLKSRQLCKRIDGTSYILTSRETLNIPPGIMCRVFPKKSLFAPGFMVSCGSAPSGFQGRIAIALFIPPGGYLDIDQGARFVSVDFWETEDDTPSNEDYAGIWGTRGHNSDTGGKGERKF